MKRRVLLWVGVRVNLLQGHDVVDGFLHFIRVDTEGRLQQLQRTREEETGQKEEKEVGTAVNRLRSAPLLYWIDDAADRFRAPYLVLGVPQR